MLKQIRKIGAAFAAVLALAGFMQLGVSAEVEEGKVNDAINWAYDTEVKSLTLSGTGALPESAYLTWEEYHTQAESLIIGAGITATGKYCFMGMTALKNITFPANDFGIEQYSFQNCTALESVTIPSTIKTLGGRAFQGCTSLKSVIIEEGVDRIVTQVFRNCINLESVKFPKSARISTGGQSDEADGNLFSGCDFDKLTVTVCKDEIQTTPDKKGYVNAYTYVRKSNETKNIYNILPNPKEDGTQNLTNYITSKGKTLIYEAVDESGNVVENIEAIPGTTLFKTWEKDTKTLTISGTGSLPPLSSGPAAYLGDCYLLAENLIICDGINGTQKHSFNGMTALKNVTFPKNDFTIGQYTFTSCTALESITIPGNVTTIAKRAFFVCTGLKTVVIEEGVGTIENEAFSTCSALETVKLPKSVMLSKLIKDGNGPGKDMAGSFSTNSKNLNITVYKDEMMSGNVVNPYSYVKSEEGFKFTVIDTIVVDGVEKTIGVEGMVGTLTWTFDIDTKTLEITGNGSVTNYSSAAAAPWAECATVAEKLVIGEGVTTIGKQAFSGMTALKEINIPSTVTAIAQYAFSECTSLEEITIPGNVSTLFARVFRGCTSLKKVEISEGVKSLGSQLFYGCTSLETVIIPASASIERTHVNYTQDGVLFRGITNFDNLIVYVYNDSDAYNYVTSDVYTITNHTNNGKADQYAEVGNYMTAGGYVLKYALLDEMSMSYNEYSMTANIISPDAMTADLIFASYDFDGVTLLDVEIQKNVSIVKGINSFKAKKIDQKAGTTTSVMLFDSIDTMNAICPAVTKQFKINIYMAGDSIMRPYKNAADYPQQGWGVPFAELFDSEMVEVHNYARGGSTTVSFYNMKNAADGNYGETGYGWIKEKIRKGDYLVIGFIHNDYNSIDIETYKEYLKKYIDETRAVGATPIFVVQPPRGTEDNQHGDFPQAMMQVAEENDVFCADTDTPLRAELVANLEEAQNKYWLYRLVERGIITEDELAVHSNLTLRDKGRDPTHISVDGAKWVANFVAGKMKDAGILSEYITLAE